MDDEAGQSMTDARLAAEEGRKKQLKTLRDFEAGKVRNQEARRMIESRDARKCARTESRGNAERMFGLQKKAQEECKRRSVGKRPKGAMGHVCRGELKKVGGVYQGQWRVFSRFSGVKYGTRRGDITTTMKAMKRALQGAKNEKRER